MKFARRIRYSLANFGSLCDSYAFICLNETGDTRPKANAFALQCLYGAPIDSLYELLAAPRLRIRVSAISPVMKWGCNPVTNWGEPQPVCWLDSIVSQESAPLFSWAPGHHAYSCLIVWAGRGNADCLNWFDDCR